MTRKIDTMGSTKIGSTTEKCADAVPSAPTDTIRMTFCKDRVIAHIGDNLVLNADARLVRSILGLVSVAIDDQLPALLDKAYIRHDKSWSVVISASLVPSELLSGEW